MIEPHLQLDCDQEAFLAWLAKPEQEDLHISFDLKSAFETWLHDILDFNDLQLMVQDTETHHCNLEINGVDLLLPQWMNQAMRDFDTLAAYQEEQDFQEKKAKGWDAAEARDDEARERHYLGDHPTTETEFPW